MSALLRQPCNKFVISVTVVGYIRQAVQTQIIARLAKVCDRDLYACTIAFVQGPVVRNPFSLNGD